MGMLLTLLFSCLPAARALQFHPHYTVQITCVGEGHHVQLHGDFSKSAFIESALVDGTEEGPDISRLTDDRTRAMTYFKPEVFSITIPGEDQNIRRFITEAEIRGERATMTCDIDIEWHLFK